MKDEGLKQEAIVLAIVPGESIDDWRNRTCKKLSQYRRADAVSIVLSDKNIKQPDDSPIGSYKLTYKNVENSSDG